ncbi:ROK family protein [Labilibaculum antarcticum]|uniref:Sugar kinase n=1 Tax=Labilibaculum antarcticum TaxID=1717717 RepID=A0A1Y1CHY9_9BACT|nr:ROK family protein [Labilibaculum antarcticum]BAX79977.1 sugar kinase [Labilibaculum antarcticum]
MKTKQAISLDLGGTAIKYALVNEAFELSNFNRIPSLANQSAKSVINQIVIAIEDCYVNAQNMGAEIVGIGIGTPGIVDDKYRTILGGADNIVGWKNIPLADIVEKKYNVPVVVENDANMMALGELASGAGINCNNVVFITVGTGIGGALFINGSLFSGHENRGTELGHIPLFVDGEDCSCGSVGCLEHYASTSALIRRFTQRCKDANLQFECDISGELIIELFNQENSLAIQCIEEHCYFLGRGVAAFINIFSPQKVIIGGGISEVGNFYISKITQTAHQFAMPDCLKNTLIESAILGNKAACIGAASLIFNSKH